MIKINNTIYNLDEMASISYGETPVMDAITKEPLTIIWRAIYFYYKNGRDEKVFIQTKEEYDRVVKEIIEYADEKEKEESIVGTILRRIKELKKAKEEYIKNPHKFKEETLLEINSRLSELESIAISCGLDVKDE